MANPFERAVEQTTEEMLEEEIRNIIRAIQAAPDGSEEQARLVQEFKTLNEQSTAIKKLEFEHEQKECENTIAEEKAFRQNLATIATTVLTTTLTVIGTIYTTERRTRFDDRWMKAFMKFEKDGEIFSSDTGRSFKQRTIGAKR